MSNKSNHRETCPGGRSVCSSEKVFPGEECIFLFKNEKSVIKIREAALPRSEECRNSFDYTRSDHEKNV
jgi:hypothetical protein